MILTVPNSIMLGEVSRMIAEGHPVVIMTKGNSMLPFIRGEMDNVELVSPADPKVGDIALGQTAPGQYVLHRIIAVDGDTFTLKGDGNLRGTETCTRDNICGKVSFILRKGGRKIDCGKPGFLRCSAFWRNLPCPARRTVLAIYRRLIKIFR